MIKILIVDDEHLARDRLARLITEGNLGEVIAEASHGLEAVEKVSQHHPDIVLLDIRMPGMDGIEAARQLSQLETPPAIIFVTAYDEYAVDAFESQAIDYLLKPIRQERLQKAIANAQRLNRLQIQALSQQNTESTPQSISVRIHSGLRQIPLDEILYFQAEHKYITVCYDRGEVIMEGALKNIESQFSHAFIRIHRNCIVSKSRLQGIRKEQQGQYFVELKDSPVRLEVSRRHVTEIKRYLKNE